MFLSNAATTVAKATSMSNGETNPLFLVSPVQIIIGDFTDL